ncbi:unnamed protein product [Adineta steineri]|uniref:G-protein coupled receptors family 1 profile domain-containing protein n=1 Tax=Adineta steineri TaxID=433720 RepID=A0A814RQ57_9BILA|nr:unnamed protein product [Adineta steineri]
MASTSSFDYASQQAAIYLNGFNLAIGIPGGFLNILVFLSLKTFRENTCSFYLIIVSCLNVGQLLLGALSRFVISGFSIDWTIMSRPYCKLRIYLFQTFSLITLTCMCLATIDQYFATCKRVRWQKWSNITTTRYLTAITIIFWSIFSILYPVYYDIVLSSTTNKLSCMNTNPTFDRYNTNFHQIIMQGFLPNFLTALFGILAYYNTKNIAYRIVPLVRRELDKQLTSMLLVQVIFNTFSLLCYNIVSIMGPYINTSKDPVVLAKFRLVQIISYSIYYFYPACPFYIYVCVSERFRRQLTYVLFVKVFKHCKRLQLAANEVEPQP